MSAGLTRRGGICNKQCTIFLVRLLRELTCEYGPGFNALHADRRAVHVCRFDIEVDVADSNDIYEPIDLSCRIEVQHGVFTAFITMLRNIILAGQQPQEPFLAWIINSHQW